MDSIYNYDKEREEAIKAGQRARNSLCNALEFLNSARRWGIYDMLGGGFISTLVKHSKMDKATYCIEAAKMDLEAFARELSDIRAYANIDLSTGDFWGFADWLFDGLFSDWIMQNRINDARLQIQCAIKKVDDILYSLK